MLATIVLGALLMTAGINPYEELLHPSADSNSAFYEGAEAVYVFNPPDGMKLVVEQAAGDGYSFAFIQADRTYDSTDIIIGATILRPKAGRLDDRAFRAMIEQDTAAIRGYYGPTLRMRAVDSVFNGSGNLLPTFFCDADRGYIPTVNVAYCNGGNEFIILELVVSDRIARFKAGPLFDQCLERFEILPKKTLAEEDRR